MKTALRFTLLFALVFCVPAIGLAKGKGKGKGKGGVPAAPASASNPAEALSPYITHVDQLLALRRQGTPQGMAFLENASGRLATMRLQFVAEKEKAAEGDRARFEAAIATCDRLSGALDERQKVLGDIRASQAVQGSGKLDAGPRKDNLTQGIKGGDEAKAVGAIVEHKREKAAARAAKNQAAANDDALTSMSANRWNKRAIELRQQITASYAQIK